MLRVGGVWGLGCWGVQGPRRLGLGFQPMGTLSIFPYMMVFTEN